MKISTRKMKGALLLIGVLFCISMTEVSSVRFAKNPFKAIKKGQVKATLAKGKLNKYKVNYCFMDNKNTFYKGLAMSGMILGVDTTATHSLLRHTTIAGNIIQTLLPSTTACLSTTDPTAKPAFVTMSIIGWASCARTEGNTEILILIFQSDLYFYFKSLTHKIK